MNLRSLHARLLAGAGLWTIGLLGTGALGMAVVSHYPQWAWEVHFAWIALLAATIASVGRSIVQRGLSPFRTLRERLADVRAGRATRLEGEFPLEVAPLVDDLNELLAERERRVARALAKAGDLAHGLKTPLAVVAVDIQQVDARGEHELAASVRVQLERMRRQIDSHLAQARVTAAGADPSARANLAEIAGGVVRTIEKLHAGHELSISTSIAPEVVVRVSTDDLEEMLGNLLDNACKWARSRVGVSATFADACVVIDVDDDGAGLDPALHEDVLRRGVRADETAPGSGLGLAIVRDLTEAYGGSVSLAQSPDGGVRARLTLPASA